MGRRWIYINGEAREVSPDYVEIRQVDYRVMSDIEPYQNMLDGREITSRSRHREFIRDNNLVELGNDSSLFAKPKPIESPPGLKEGYIRAVNELEERQRRR